MSGTEMAGLISRIDASISDSEQRIQEQVSEYIKVNPERIVRQLRENGKAIIPTFAGDFEFNEDTLQKIMSIEAVTA